MRRTRLPLVLGLAVLLAAFVPAGAHAQQATASPQPAPDTSGSPPPIPAPKPGPDDPARHKLAVQQFLAWQAGSVDRSLYDDAVNGELSDEVLDSATRTLANMGALQSAVYLGTSHARGANIFVYKMTCERGSVNMDFALDPDGKIGIIFFE
jgi:hypothetical protein